MVLDELERAENVIPGYGQNMVPPPPPPPEADKVPCPECKKLVKATYLQGHMLKQHRIGRKREFKERKKGTNSKPKTEVATIPAPEPQQPEEPLTADGVMSTLIELRWPHSMSTKRVQEMIELRTALEKFLS
jgi:hypothetical protein